MHKNAYLFLAWWLCSRGWSEGVPPNHYSRNWWPSRHLATFLGPFKDLSFKREWVVVGLRRQQAGFLTLLSTSQASCILLHLYSPNRSSHIKWLRLSTGKFGRRKTLNNSNRSYCTIRLLLCDCNETPVCRAVARNSFRGGYSFSEGEEFC